MTSAKGAIFVGFGPVYTEAIYSHTLRVRSQSAWHIILRITIFNMIVIIKNVRERRQPFDKAQIAMKGIYIFCVDTDVLAYMIWSLFSHLTLCA